MLRLEAGEQARRRAKVGDLGARRDAGAWIISAIDPTSGADGPQSTATRLALLTARAILSSSASGTEPWPAVEVEPLAVGVASAAGADTWTTRIAPR